MSRFDASSEQHEAKRLLEAALARGAGARLPLPRARRRRQARARARLRARAARDDRARSHPDLYVLDALGEMIRIDAIRELRRDLHMRPFEADRRVYLIFGAHLMNEDAADALLKDLEEPPAYAVIVLVADDLGPIPETIRSRCQLVPFTRLSERAIRDGDRRAGAGARRRRSAPRSHGSRAGGSTGWSGCSTRTRPRGARRCSSRRGPSTASRRSSRPTRPRRCSRRARQRGAEARELEEVKVQGLELPAREAEQRVRRAQRGAEREELLAQLEELAAWYRDLVVVGGRGRGGGDPRRPARGAPARTRRASALLGAERAAEAVRRNVAAARGVQPGAAARARGAVRAGGAGAAGVGPAL